MTARLRATIEVEVDVTDDELALLQLSDGAEIGDVTLTESQTDTLNDLLDELSSRALDEVRGQYIDWQTP